MLQLQSQSQSQATLIPLIIIMIIIITSVMMIHVNGADEGADDEASIGRLVLGLNWLSIGQEKEEGEEEEEEKRRIGGANLWPWTLGAGLLVCWPIWRARRVRFLACTKRGLVCARIMGVPAKLAL